MRISWVSAAVIAALVLGTVTAARADEVTPPAAPPATPPAAPAPAAAATPPAAPAPAAEATPLNYVTAAATTTLFSVPKTGDSSGWGHDIGPVIGAGRYVTETVALELDVGPSYARGKYQGFFLVPAAVWSFSTHVYAAARFLVQMDPNAQLFLFPGIGGAYSFDKITLTLEMNLERNVGQGDPAFGITLTPGIVYSF